MKLSSLKPFLVIAMLLIFAIPSFAQNPNMPSTTKIQSQLQAQVTDNTKDLIRVWVIGDSAGTVSVKLDSALARYALLLTELSKKADGTDLDTANARFALLLTELSKKTDASDLDTANARFALLLTELSKKTDASDLDTANARYNLLLTELSKKENLTDILVTASLAGGDTLIDGRDDFAATFVSTVATSLVSSFSSWHQGNITVTDTAEISTDSTFAAGTVQQLLPGIKYDLPKASASGILNYYLRRFVTSGATGTVYWSARLWGI